MRSYKNIPLLYEQRGYSLFIVYFSSWSVILNQPLATSLGLNVQALQSEDGVEVLDGNRIPEGASPLAESYAGHQFGHFTMLGDGRALLIDEQITSVGERFDIQLKGSGRAALGPMLSEYMRVVSRGIRKSATRRKAPFPLYRVFHLPLVPFP